MCVAMSTDSGTPSARTRSYTISAHAAAPATIAWSGALLVISRMAARFDLVEELLDPVLAGDRFVVHERHFRRPLQAQPRSDLAAEERRGALQRAGGVAATLLVAERRVVDA